MTQPNTPYLVEIDVVGTRVFEIYAEDVQDLQEILDKEEFDEDELVEDHIDYDMPSAVIVDAHHPLTGESLDPTPTL